MPSSVIRHPCGQQNPTVIWTVDYEVRQISVGVEANNSDLLSREGVMRIAHHDFEMLFLGRISRDRRNEWRVIFTAAS